MDLHPRDDLSALLDGELPDDVAAGVYAHVLTCSDCAAELDAARHARLELRMLPAVEPPPGFLDALLERSLSDRPPVVRSIRQRTTKWAVVHAAVAATAGLVLVTSGSTSAASAVTPSVGTAMARHAATLSALSSDGDAVASPDDQPARVTSLGRPYVAPASLDGYRLVDAFQESTGVQLVYEKGSAGLSVFEEPGALDASDLPAGATRTSISGEAAWTWNAGRVVVLHRGDVVITLVGDGNVTAAAADLPGASASLGTQFARACGDALRDLSPAG